MCLRLKWRMRAACYISDISLIDVRVCCVFLQVIGNPHSIQVERRKGKKKVCSMKRLANRGHETESNIAYAPLSSTIKVPNDGFQIPVICSAEASCTVRGVSNRRLHKHCAHAKHETGHSSVTSSIRYSMTQCPCNYSS